MMAENRASVAFALTEVKNIVIEELELRNVTLFSPLSNRSNTSSASRVLA